MTFNVCTAPVCSGHVSKDPADCPCMGVCICHWPKVFEVLDNPDEVPLNWKGKPVTISSSGIDTFLACQRKWWYGYIERKRSETEATRIGGIVHDLAECYLNGDLDFDPWDEDVEIPNKHKRYWRILEPGTAFAPTPKQIKDEGWRVETWLEFPCGPIKYVGKVDIHLDDPKDLSNPIISDWKTSGRKDYHYAKTPDQLAELGQPLVYAYALYHDAPPNFIDFQHINMVSKGKADAMEVWAYNVPWATVVAHWNEVVLPTANAMYEVAKTCTVAKEVDTNEDACYDYAGCSHAEYCSASPINRHVITTDPKIEGAKLMANSSKTKDRLAKLRAKAGIGKAKKAAAITPAVDDKPAQPDTPPIDKVVKLWRELLDNLGFVPEGAGILLAESEGVMPFEVLKVLNLRKDGAMFVPKPPAAPEPMPEIPVFEAGITLKALEAALDADDVTVSNVLEVSKLKVMFGMCVDADFDGNVTAMYQRYMPDTETAAIAEAIEEVAPDVETEEVEEVEEVEEDAPRVAIDDPPIEEPEAPKLEVTDINVRIAEALIAYMVEMSTNSISKGKATPIIRGQDETIKRVRGPRWDAILLASEGKLSLDGTTLRRVPTLGEGQATVGFEITQDDIDEATTPELLEMGKEAALEELIEILAEGTNAELAEVQAQDEVHEEAARALKAELDDATEFFGGRKVQVPEVLINCIPMGGDYVTFNQWIARYELETEAVTQSFALTGDRPARVLHSLYDDLKARGPKALPDVMVVLGNHDLLDKVLPLFERLGDNVRIIRGV